MTKRFFSQSIFTRYLHHSLPARLLGFINHLVEGESPAVTALHAGRCAVTKVTLLRALEGLLVDIGRNHGCIGTDHVAHEAANAPRFVLDNEIPRSHLERLSNTGIYAGGFFTLFTETEDRTLAAEKGPDVGEYFGGREFPVFPACVTACLFALATEVT